MPKEIPPEALESAQAYPAKKQRTYDIISCWYCGKDLFTGYDKFKNGEIACQDCLSE